MCQTTFRFRAGDKQALFIFRRFNSPRTVTGMRQRFSPFEDVLTLLKRCMCRSSQGSGCFVQDIYFFNLECLSFRVGGPDFSNFPLPPHHLIPVKWRVGRSSRANYFPLALFLDLCHVVEDALYVAAVAYLFFSFCMNPF